MKKLTYKKPFETETFKIFFERMHHDRDEFRTAFYRKGDLVSAYVLIREQLKLLCI